MLLLVSFITFILVHYAGSDQLYERLGKNATQEEVIQLQTSMHQTDAVTRQYLAYLDYVVIDFHSIPPTTIQRVHGQLSPLGIKLKRPKQGTVSAESE